MRPDIDNVHEFYMSQRLPLPDAVENFWAAMYPLYHGYAVGAESTEVYDEGGTEVWRAMAVRGAIMGVVGLFGAHFFISFFFKTGSVGEGSAKREEPDVRAAGPNVNSPAPAMPMVPKAARPPDPYANMTVQQRYVAQLNDANRIRLVFLATVGEREVGRVEWVDSSGNSIIGVGNRPMATFSESVQNRHTCG